jgi:hypothetical protein
MFDGFVGIATDFRIDKICFLQFHRAHISIAHKLDFLIIPEFPG